MVLDCLISLEWRKAALLTTWLTRNSGSFFVNNLCLNKPPASCIGLFCFAESFWPGFYATAAESTVV
jgi:hypothetical protein